ncbi:yellow cameleon 2.60 [Tribonema minus]|uniref:Calmodulin n=1 Tax=Tribonema minus TaxID=303371 RepID=A0A835YUT0_9STRA|nr:yellow cameleon 2.60 [Tribonema minus]|eukprot:TRINITY_DN3456_c1_g3_i1.p1 TRINITY_DN3456_c1_g3~~TRINITY_DN3456_c1_g3_i1.p1  ORF type:complete len:156 (+),score=63.66 TRINITY_DN3456_c1_g3_i1:217-684(+)
MSAFADGNMREATEEELEDYREAFNNFDKDQSGEIDEYELGTVMRSLGYNPTDEQLHDMMLKVDIDGNGSISFDEFVIMMRKCEVETDFDREITEAFKVFDKDGSGSIDKEELTAIMKGLGANLSDQEIELLVREADADGDGSIDLQEFLKIMYH